MSEQIQLQKKNSNIFCYCDFVTRAGKIIVECETVEFNPETESNTDLEQKEYTIEDFCVFLKKKEWMVC